MDSTTIAGIIVALTAIIVTMRMGDDVHTCPLYEPAQVGSLMCS